MPVSGCPVIHARPRRRAIHVEWGRTDEGPVPSPPCRRLVVQHASSSGDTKQPSRFREDGVGLSRFGHRLRAGRHSSLDSECRLTVYLVQSVKSCCTSRCYGGVRFAGLESVQRPRSRRSTSNGGSSPSDASLCQSGAWTSRGCQHWVVGACNPSARATPISRQAHSRSHGVPVRWLCVIVSFRPRGGRSDGRIRRGAGRGCYAIRSHAWPPRMAEASVSKPRAVGH